MIEKYRKKPVEIEAVQFSCEDDYDRIREWCKDFYRESTGADGGVDYCVETLEGNMHTQVGDWIIKGIQGEFYPCKPDIFEATYDSVRQPHAKSN